MNKVVLSGKLTKDVEVNYTSSNKAIAKLNIYEADQKTFLDITCWEELAKSVGDLAKDVEVNIEGYIKKRSYEDKNGHKVYVTEILASSCNQSVETPESSNLGEVKAEENDPFKDFGNEVELTDDDLPW